MGFPGFAMDLQGDDQPDSNQIWASVLREAGSGFAFWFAETAQSGVKCLAAVFQVIFRKYKEQPMI